MEDWEQLHSATQWKSGRSAHSVADFIVNRNGAGRLRDRVSWALEEPVEFRTITPEYEVRFDRYGQGRVHDLGIRGMTASGKSLFVGVEAKVDESFGQSVAYEWQEAAEREASGQRTNKPARIRELLARFTEGPGITEESEVRYQLLYGTAGTVDAGADVSVFYVAVFVTDAYRPAYGEKNYQDYLQFIEAAGGSPASSDSAKASVHELTLSGRDLVAIYEYFDIR